MRNYLNSISIDLMKSFSYEKVLELSNTAKMLSSQMRITIVLLLSQQKKARLTASDLAQECSTTIFNISQHTNKLERSGYIKKSKSGPYTYHSLTPSGRKLAKIVERYCK